MSGSRQGELEGSRPWFLLGEAVDEKGLLDTGGFGRALSVEEDASLEDEDKGSTEGVGGTKVY